MFSFSKIRVLTRTLRNSAIVFIALVVSGYAVAQTVDVRPIVPSDNAPEGAVGVTPKGDFVDEEGYRIREEGESEFDNYSGSFVNDWRLSEADYEDTEFGELMYNEASTPTKLEILRLLSKDTPSLAVFLHALAMGIDIEETLQASVRYEPNKGRDLAASAVSLIPILSDSSPYKYAGYELEDLEREDENSPYKVEEVIRNFFEDRLVLRPLPDWFEGQYHFLASAAELKKIQTESEGQQWYRSKSTQEFERRPVFVSLYESSKIAIVDSEDRIDEALASDPQALLPVVFIFNKLNERPIDDLGYPKTIRGVQSAYVDQSIMLTPTPEWQLGEYHMYADIKEFYEIFEIPDEEDFEPDEWLRLLEEAEDYAVTDTSFLMVVLGGGSTENSAGGTQSAAMSGFNDVPSLEYAAWDNPRSESSFEYRRPSDGAALSLENITGDGLVFNRPDLIAALNTLGVSKVPLSFYYVDETRMKPYVKGPKGLLGIIEGARRFTDAGGRGGITLCASPPCISE